LSGAGKIIFNKDRYHEASLYAAGWLVGELFQLSFSHSSRF
jgi:hypothetical protein